VSKQSILVKEVRLMHPTVRLASDYGVCCERLYYIWGAAALYDGDEMDVELLECHAVECSCNKISCCIYEWKGDMV
jgi:hypothetical protein